MGTELLSLFRTGAEVVLIAAASYAPESIINSVNRFKLERPFYQPQNRIYIPLSSIESKQCIESIVWKRDPNNPLVERKVSACDVRFKTWREVSPPEVIIP